MQTASAAGRDGQRQDRRPAVVGDDQDPDRVDRDHHKAHPAEPASGAVCSLTQLTSGPDAEERRPVHETEHHQRHPGPQAERREEVPERAGELAVRVDGQTRDQVAQRDPEHERGKQAADRQRAAPQPAPAWPVDLAAELEGHAADDQRHQQQHEREVARREPGGVPVGEGGEDRRTADDQPDLVAVPERADGVDRHPALASGPAEDPVQHPDTEVEALQDEEAGPEDRDDHEPQLG